LVSALEDTARLLLIELLKTYSPTNREKPAVEVLEKYAWSLGYEDVHVDRVGNLIAHYGSGDETVAFVGHIDTVDGELPVSVDRGIVTGRGAVDAKGPLAAMFVGVAMAKGVVDPSKWRIYAIAAVGEEGDSRGARELVRSGFSANGVVVAEPSNTRFVVIGYRGSLKVEITCSSRRGHASSPSFEMSACEKLICLWSTIRSTCSSFSAHGNSATLLYLSCGSSTAQSVYPSEGRMLIDVRVSVNGRANSVLEELVKAVNRLGCTVKIIDSAPPVKVSPNAPIVRATMRSLLMQGVKPRLTYKLGTSDMNLLHPLSGGNIVAYGPGKSELSHGEFEAISLEELFFGVRIYRDIILNYVKLTERASKTQATTFYYRF